jgi:competence protein ComEA
MRVPPIEFFKWNEVLAGRGAKRRLIMKNSKKFLALSLVVVVLASVAPILWAESAQGQGTEKVNINTATAEEIAQLKNIGTAYAMRIVEYRQENGPFEKPEDILKVRGIGEKTYALNKEKITVK